MALWYLTLFVALPWLVFEADPSLRPMLVFQVYGAFWAGWAAMTTRLASAAVYDILDSRVIDRLSDAAALWVDQQLDAKQYARPHLLISAWMVGIIGAATAAALLAGDLSGIPLPALLWWALGWALLYATAAKVVLVGRFYTLFAEAVARHPEMLFPLHPSRSPMVTSLALVAKRMLAFWVGIAVATALIIPFAFNALPDSAVFAIYGFELPASQFVLAHLAITSVFSIGVGSYMFLRSEAALRRAVWCTAERCLLLIEQEVKSRLEGGLGEDRVKRLAELDALHAEVAAGGVYRALIGAGISIFIPFVPLIGLVLKPWLG